MSAAKTDPMMDAIQSAIGQNTQRPTSGFNDLITVIYGDKKVGKSTFASRYDKPLFLDCEDALRMVELPDGTRPPQISIEGWDKDSAGMHSPKTLTYWTEALANPEIREKLGIKTLVIDGLGEAYARCEESILKAKGAESINDGVLGYGKGGELVRKAMRKWFTDLRRLSYAGIGIVLTAHECTVEFDSNGAKFDKKTPLVSGDKGERGWTVIKPSVDMIIYASKRQTPDGLVHMMRLRGNQMIEAAAPPYMPEEWPFSQPEARRLFEEKGLVNDASSGSDTANAVVNKSVEPAAEPVS